MSKMPNTRIIRSVLKEYGVRWIINRLLYSGKLNLMGMALPTEQFFEKKNAYPKHLDLFRINVDELKAFLFKLDKSEKDQLIAAADKACEGIIIGFSSIDLNYGNPIDWQFSPLTGKKCNAKKKWYKIPDFDEERGDIKIIWEASRFSHFITLARAFMLTGTVKYYRAFSNQLKDWLSKNPYSYGANYKCGQECSLRMVNALLAFTVFRNLGISSDADASNMKELIDRCYRKVVGNFFYSYKCIKNNHTISELMGIIVGALCCENHRQLDKAYKLLDEVINEQFTNDGGYCQFSFNYQRLALQDLECVLSLRWNSGRSLSKKSMNKIMNAAFLMYQCQDQSGDMPNYGCNDGALAFPVTACGYRDFSPVINTSYALTTNMQLYESGKHQEELIWFSGGKPLRQYHVYKIDKMSFRFLDAGLFTFRNRKSWAMMVLNDYHSRPAHMDQLHIDLWIDSKNVLCDGGTYSYASDIGKKLVMNESHNTAVVIRKNQMNTNGAFLVFNWTKRILKRCDNHLFEGTVISQNGYVHTRQVEIKNGRFEINDTVDNDFRLFFHTPYDCIIHNGTVNIYDENRLICSIITNGEISMMRSINSLYYLRKKIVTCIVVKGKANKTVKSIIQVIEGETKR